MITRPSDVESFAEIVAEHVAERLSRRPLLVDRYALSALTGLSVPTIDRRRKDGTIPSVKVGSRVLFDPKAVISALSQGAYKHD